MAQLGVTQLWSGVTIAIGSAATSSPVDISKTEALALHVTSLTGGTPDVTFTYTLSNSLNGTYVAGEATVGANVAAAKVMDFAPEAARYMKVIATNNNGAAAAVISAELAVQEL